MPSRPARGAWVEILIGAPMALTQKSRPARGAWVEMYIIFCTSGCTWSRPARGAWVEMIDWSLWPVELYVAPRKGRVG